MAPDNTDSLIVDSLIANSAAATLIFQKDILPLFRNIITLVATRAKGRRAAFNYKRRNI